MKFTYNSRIIKHLGYELITSDEVAITELIKNSYDAKARKVNIQFLSTLEDIKTNALLQPIPARVKKQIESLHYNGIILLEDNGGGMDHATLIKGFFEVGGTLKKEQKENDSNDDQLILGEKGIGRLAAQRISPLLIVETAVKDKTVINVVQVDWQTFIADRDAEAPEWKIRRTEAGSYTRLWLIGNEENPIDFNRFFEAKEKFSYDIFGNPIKSLGFHLYMKDELQTALSFLYSPFEPQKTILDLKLFYSGRNIIYDFNYKIIDIAESIHSLDSTIIYDEQNKPIDLEFKLKLNIRPWFVERIHLSELGKVLYQDWKRPHTYYKKLLEKYKDHYERSLTESFFLSSIFKKWNKKYKDKLPAKFISALLQLSPIQGKIYSFKRDSALISMAIESAVDNNYIEKDIEGIKTDFREFLSANNGIKLYRNSFRIGTIGNKDNDWLKLQQKRTTGQQFYRFELGNVIGFIKINDKKQKYIYETSSRETLTENVYVNALQVALSEIIEIFSPGFNKKAVEITKYILDLENLIPENSSEQLEKEVDKSKQLLNAARNNVNAIKEAITAVKDNLDLDTEEKINAVRKVFKELEPATLDFEQNIEDTNRSFRSANTLLEVAKQQQIRIKTEAYNNYKLMANGLVTEVITHELHSLLSNSETETKKYNEHFQVLENYFFGNKLFELNSKELLPIKEKFTHLYSRMGDLNKFYSFLEKTFIYKGNSEDLIPTSVKQELEEITERFKFRLVRHKININYNDVNNVWEVPKGSLLHVFYNLIDNSIYWIKQRQRLSKSNSLYKTDSKDSIIIRSINESTIQFFDSGTGVLEKYQYTLFNEMESGKENGRGMGLYIVRQFLKSFGGNIELLESKNAYGNRYIFEIRMKNNLQEDGDS